MLDSDLLDRACDASADGARELRVTVFEQLGWDVRRITTGTSEVLSLRSEGQPQVLVVAGLTPSAAVSLGYSGETTFTLNWDTSGLRLLPTRWWSEVPGDRTEIAVPEGTGRSVAQALQAIHRDKLRAVASGLARPRIAPLVDRLAGAFALLRMRAAELGRSESDAFQLFHQLLFIRFHEDRFGSASGAQVVRELAADERSSREAIADTIGVYAAVFNSELFDNTSAIFDLPVQDVRRVVLEMSEPWNDLRIDFQVTDNDIAGRLYQSYLALAPKVESEDRLFPVASQTNRQKEVGAFYTPRRLADDLTAETIDPWLEKNQPAEPGEVRVVDLACGSGVFLLAAYHRLLDYFMDARGRPLTSGERISILTECIFGCDLDSSAVSMARVQLLEEASVGPRRLPMLGKNVVHGDGLLESVPALWGVRDCSEAGFDLVLSNPPFHAPKGAIEAGFDTSELHRQFTSAAGTGWNLAYLFVERGLSLLARNGRLGVILPQVALDGPSSAALRSVVGRKLTSVTDYGGSPLFGAHMVYVATMTAQNEKRRSQAKVSLVRRYGSEELPYRVKPNELGGGVRDDRRLFEIQAPVSKVEATDTWSPFVHRWLQFLDHDVGVGTVPVLVEGDEVIVGTQTGRDRAFVLSGARWTPQGTSHLLVDGRFKLRTEDVPKWAPGKTVRPFRVDWLGQRVALPELGRNRALDEFIEFHGGRPPSFFPGRLEALRGPKVIVRCLFDEAAAVSDSTGEWMIPQGGGGCHAIPVHDPVNADYLEALLNSALYQWLLAGIVQPKSSGYQQILLHHWRHVRFPILSDAERDRIREAGSGVREALTEESASVRLSEYWSERKRLDDAVFEVMRASSALRETVTSELRRRA